MEKTLDAIFSNATRVEDKIPAYIVLVYARGKGQSKVGFRIICDVLSDLGEQINPKPGTFTMMKTSLRMKCSLFGKSFDFLSNLPDANEDNLIISHFLSFAMFFINIVLPDTSFLLGSRLICFSVKNGITGPAAVAFAQYGYISTVLGKSDEGYRFSRLSLLFADRFEVWRPRIYLYVHGLTNFWSHPLRDSVDPLHRAQCDAIKYGDLQIYCILAGFIIFVLLRSGAPLNELQIDALSFCQSIAELGELSALFMVLPMNSVIHDLTGSQESLDIPGEIRDSESAMKYASKEGAIIMLGHCEADRAMLCFLVGDYQKALEMARKAHEHRNGFDFNVTFYEGLATSALAWTLKSRKRWNHISRCRKLARRIRNWADRCPANFLNKQMLVEAEIAALRGELSSAVALYDKSASKARLEGFIHEEGIAYERLGQYQLHLGSFSVAKMSFERARVAFEKWGATIVVDRINRLMATIEVE